MIRPLVILTVTFNLVLGCGIAKLQNQPTPPRQAYGYKLDFQDEFDTLDISPDGRGKHTWYEGVWFNHRHAPLSNISASLSTLKLEWHRGQGSPDTSITTLSRDKRRFRAWRYGYFEARMKWDVVTGAWPAFWLIPVEDATDKATYNGVKQTGEIDIFEGQGDKRHDFYGTIHVWVNLKDNASKENRFRLPASVNFSDYHTYGLLWTPGKVTWYFDNQALHSETTPAVLDKQKYFLVLSMQEGVNWKSGVLSGVNWNKIALYVDWVRVWRK
jgi:beta-glucanase (GH16 family)